MKRLRRCRRSYTDITSGRRMPLAGSKQIAAPCTCRTRHGASRCGIGMFTPPKPSARHQKTIRERDLTQASDNGDGSFEIQLWYSSDIHWDTPRVGNKHIHITRAHSRDTDAVRVSPPTAHPVMSDLPHGMNVAHRPGMVWQAQNKHILKGCNPIVQLQTPTSRPHTVRPYGVGCRGRRRTRPPATGRP